MQKIFISYRRADSATASGRIYDRLVRDFGKGDVFKDVDDIPPGADFADYIQQSLRQCAVVLVVIGPRWLEVRTKQGERRLDDPADYVRLEIETALSLGLVVIPLLVDGARPLDGGADLPESLRRLTRVNAVEVRNDPDFTRDMERVTAEIKRHVPATPPPPPPRPIVPPTPIGTTSSWTNPTPVYTLPQPSKLPRPRRRLWPIYAAIGVIGVCVALILGNSLLTNALIGAAPKGVTNAMILAPVVAQIKTCASAATASPANCPQRDQNIYGSSIVWTLHGDPAAGAQVAYTGQNKWSVNGVFVMTVGWDGGGSGLYAAKLDWVAQGYQAAVKWDGHQTALASTVTGTDRSSLSVQVPRPASATLQVVQQAVRSQFNYCAAQTTDYQPITCPQIFVFSGGTNYRYALQTDPVKLATETYDSGTGITHLVGSYAMGVSYTASQGTSQHASTNGNYDALLTMDNGKLTVIYMIYS